jgi:hypothetical protein
MEKVGDWIRIINMSGEPLYTGRIGQITHIDDIGQLHGTWGGLALVPDEDQFEIIDNPQNAFVKKVDDGFDWKVYETKDGDQIYVPHKSIERKK